MDVFSLFSLWSLNHHFQRPGTQLPGRCLPFSKLIITAGPWTNSLLSKAELPQVPMVVSNEQTVELRPKVSTAEKNPSYDWDVFPIFTWSEAGYKGRGKDGGCEYYYTTPHVSHPNVPSEGVKIGFHRQGPLLNTEDFQVSSEGQAAVHKLPHIRKDGFVFLKEKMVCLGPFFHGHVGKSWYIFRKMARILSVVQLSPTTWIRTWRLSNNLSWTPLHGRRFKNLSARRCQDWMQSNMLTTWGAYINARRIYIWFLVVILQILLWFLPVAFPDLVSSLRLPLQACWQP